MIYLKKGLIKFFLILTVTSLFFRCDSSDSFIEKCNCDEIVDSKSEIIEKGDYWPYVNSVKMDLLNYVMPEDSLTLILGNPIDSNLDFKDYTYLYEIEGDTISYRYNSDSNYFEFANSTLHNDQFYMILDGIKLDNRTQVQDILKVDCFVACFSDVDKINNKSIELELRNHFGHFSFYFVEDRLDYFSITPN